MLFKFLIPAKFPISWNCLGVKNYMIANLLSDSCNVAKLLSDSLFYPLSLNFSNSEFIRCTRKLKKATKALFTDFFHAICPQRWPMARTALKHEHIASKLNPSVKIIKKSQSNDYLLKKLFVAHFFSIIAH